MRNNAMAKPVERTPKRVTQAARAGIDVTLIRWMVPSARNFASAAGVVTVSIRLIVTIRPRIVLIFIIPNYTAE